MADSFQKRTIANRINFGMRRTKWLIAMMHWVQDFYHCSKQPTIDDFVTANNSSKHCLLQHNVLPSVRSTPIRLIQLVRRPTRASSRMKGSGQNGIPLSSITFLLYLGSMVYHYPTSFGKTKRQTTPVILRATSQRRSLLAHL